MRHAPEGGPAISRVRNIVLGCVAVPLGLLVVLFLLGLGLYLAGPVEQHPQNTDVDIPVASDSVAAEQVAGTVVATAIRVELRLEEGHFRVRPGVAGQGVRVEAEYDEALHQLDTAYDPSNAGGHSVFRLDFASRGQLGNFRRLVHRQENAANVVRVYLPPDVPMQLEVRARKGDLDLDLTGLSIEELVLDCAMGGFGLDIDEPNPIAMQRFEIRFQMGDFRASGLGNAGASALLLRSRMGNADLDFDGEWRSDLIADVHVAMGDANLRLPREVELDAGNARVILGEFDKRSRAPTRRDPEAAGQPKLMRADVLVSFGTVSFR